MTKHKLTPWFPADVKPVRHGIYERSYGFFKLKDLWDGNYWRYQVSKKICFNQNRDWRGIQK